MLFTISDLLYIEKFINFNCMLSKYFVATGVKEGSRLNIAGSCQQYHKKTFRETNAIFRDWLTERRVDEPLAVSTVNRFVLTRPAGQVSS